MSSRWPPGWLPGNRLAVYVVGALVAVLLAVILVRCGADDEAPDDGTPAKVRLTPITRFDPASVRPVRAGFCEVVPEGAIRTVVGKVTVTEAWGDGDARPVTRTMTDVVHEYGCRWTGNRGDSARAWVFVPRVAPQRARGLVAEARRERGCRTVDSHNFGTPSVGLVCRVRAGREVSYRGLFVDTWFTCTFTDRRRQLPEEKLLKRAGQWCVAVAQATSG